MVGIMVLSRVVTPRIELLRDIVFQLKTFIKEDIVLIDIYNKLQLRQFVCSDVETLYFDVFSYFNLNEMMADFKGLLQQLGVDIIFIIGFPSYKGFEYFDQGRFYLFRETVMKEKRKMRTKTYTGYMRVTILYLLLVLNEMNMNVVHYALSTNEPVLNCCFENMNYKRYGPLWFEDFPYAPFYEYTMEWEMQSFDKSKTENFVFGGYKGKPNNFFEGRPFLENLEAKLTKQGFDFCCVDRYRDKRFVSQFDYYKLLAKAKYTYIPPSNGEYDFSIFRFMESCMLDCVPIVDTDCYIYNLARTFPDMNEIIKDKMTISRRRIVRRTYMYKRDINVLNDLKETKSYRKITSYESVKNFFDGLLREIRKCQ